MLPKKFSFLELSRLKLIASSNNKFLYKSDVIKNLKDYRLDYQLGGQDNYFINLSRGAYRRDSTLTERTWKFLFKYLVVAKQIFDKAKEKNKTINVLDIGCSKGFLRRILESNIRKDEKIVYVGIDLSRSKLEETVFNENSLESGAGGDKILSAYIWHNAAKHLPLKLRSFDFIICFQMIKYLPREEVLNLLKEIFRVLKKDGLFFLFTDPIFNKQNKNKNFNKMKLVIKGYQSFWTEKSIRKILKSTGFQETPILGLVAEDGEAIRYLKKVLPEEITEALISICRPELYPEKLFIFKK